MAGVLRREALPEEDVAQVSLAVGAFDLYPHAVGVRQSIHCAWDFLVERGPAAVGLKFVSGVIELSVAAAADINALLEEIIVLSGEGRFRSLGLDDITLFRREGIIVCLAHIQLSSSLGLFARLYFASFKSLEQALT
jgi:hypothetical protein